MQRLLPRCEQRKHLPNDPDGRWSLQDIAAPATTLHLQRSEIVENAQGLSESRSGGSESFAQTAFRAQAHAIRRNRRVVLNQAGGDLKPADHETWLYHARRGEQFEGTLLQLGDEIASGQFLKQRCGDQERFIQLYTRVAGRAQEHRKRACSPLEVRLGQSQATIASPFDQNRSARFEQANRLAHHISARGEPLNEITFRTYEATDNPSLFNSIVFNCPCNMRWGLPIAGVIPFGEIVKVASHHIERCVLRNEWTIFHD